MAEVKEIRCIDTKTGQVKFIPETIVKNAKFMAKYGYKEQETMTITPVRVPEPETELPTDLSEKSTIDSQSPEVNVDDSEEMVAEIPVSLSEAEQSVTEKPAASKTKKK